LRRQHAAAAATAAATTNGHKNKINDGIRVSASADEGDAAVAPVAKRQQRQRGSSGCISSKKEFGHSTSTRVVCNRENVDW